MREIQLTQGKVALVDDEDYELASRFRWYVERKANGWYARRNIRRPDGRKAKILLHRAILGAEPGVGVDHINRDGLDNRRSNLRWASTSQNGANRGLNANSTSGYKGVDFQKARGCWRALIECRGRRLHLGVYATPEEAARAYDRAAVEFFGAFARPNFQEVAA